MRPPVSPLLHTHDPMDLLLFGGSFDPPHRGHTEIAMAARLWVFGSASLPWIVFVPAAKSPLKVDATRTPDTIRVELVRLAVAGIKNATVWTDEIDRSAAQAGGSREPSFTIDTLTRLKTVLPNAKPRLLIGADQAAAFHLWRDYREVLSMAPPVVACRDKARSADTLITRMKETQAWNARELAQWRDWIMPPLLIEASSSRLRELLGRPRLADSERLLIERNLAPAVLAKIRSAGVYTGGVTR